ncbi:MAG: ribonuclease III [Cyanobacteria bacterium]|nr:ribonuclease III [Cyanobacteriota bacterium]
MDDRRRLQLDTLMESLDLSPIETPSVYDLFDRALTHSSFTYENKLNSLENYERLEFLGDAVLKLIVSEYLFERFPDYREGELTKIRAVIVSDATLADFARLMELGEFMVFGKSEARNNGANKVSNLACGFEAFLGALFLDGRLVEIRHLLVSLLEEQVTLVDMSKTKDNYKAVLQELTQAEGHGIPAYRTVLEEGPPHNKTFFIEVLVNQEPVGHGQGKSKKEAQQSAAKMALEVFNALEE